ncbi:MAG: GGDEF domain-containing protein, partial [Desulfobacterales bacterium]
MRENILIVSDREQDLALIEDLLDTERFIVTKHDRIDDIEEMMLSQSFSAIIADLDLAGDRVSDWLTLLEEKGSRSCLIVYGEDVSAEELSEILQKGAYGFVPRARLTERICDTIMGGLENRKAFMEILGMMDDLKAANEKLSMEKSALAVRNEALAFINRLSSEVAYDRNWTRILPRIIDAEFKKVIDSQFISMLYRIGTRWNLDLYLSGMSINREMLDVLRAEIADKFFSFSAERIPVGQITTHLYPPDLTVSSSTQISIANHWTLPLESADQHLGMFTVLPYDGDVQDPEKKEFMSTVTNILAMSLRNAKEYYRLKDMTIKDSLTEILNRKGFEDYLGQEFQKARRYRKSLSLIMIDVDNFKDINDSLGHPAGDYVLSELAGCLKNPLRQSDVLARYGGDEFAIILPETGIKKAEIFIKRILSVVQDHPFYWQAEHINVE